MMLESRIDMTDRLRREGRWEEASAARDQERNRLRATGLHRQEANERSWAWLLEEYPPLTDEQIARHESDSLAAMAEFPPECDGVDEEAELPLAAYWWTFCHLLAWESQWTQDRAECGRAYLQRMLRQAPSQEAARLALLAAESPTLFLGQLRVKLLSVLGRWHEAAMPPAPEYRPELEFQLQAVDRLESLLMGTLPAARSPWSQPRPENDSQQDRRGRRKNSAASGAGA